MIRAALLLLCATLVCKSLHAQKNKPGNANFPPFGVVDKADLEMKDCSFEEQAPALVLLDDGLLEYVFGRGMELKRRIRIKILNEKGKDWADVHLPYKDAGHEQDITGVEAQTYNLDAQGNVVITKVDKSLIYDKKLNKKHNEKVFTFPEVKVGSIIEYKFKHSGVGLIDWYFQRSIPVKHTHFTIDFPEEIDVRVNTVCSRPYEFNKESKGTRVIKHYTISNVPSFQSEPYIINEDFYRARLETKVIAYTVNGYRKSRIVNWAQVIDFLSKDEDFGMQINKSIPRTADLDQKLSTITSPYERMKTIYRYVQENMVWNEYAGIWAANGVKAAWKDKKGTVGEINLILVNLLKDAGLDAHPILVSTHKNGVVNSIDAGTYEWPGFNQFNKTLAYVIVGTEVYVLDATQKNMPVHLFPTDVVLSEGLVIEKIESGKWGWKTLWKDNLQSRNLIQIVGRIDAAGKMNGQAIIHSFDYEGLQRKALVKAGKDKYLEQYVTAAHPDMEVQELNFENLADDSLPLKQTLKFTQSLNGAGDYRFFSANLLSGIEKNPFIADTRFSDVFFGLKKNITVTGNYTAPEGYVFGELPKNKTMILPDTSISVSRFAQVENNNLKLRITVNFKRPVYPATEYDMLQEFYQQLYAILNEQFIIQKKG